MQLTLVYILKNKMPPAVFLAWTAASGLLRLGVLPQSPAALGPDSAEGGKVLHRVAHISSSCLWCQLVVLGLDIRRRLKDGALRRWWRGPRYSALSYAHLTHVHAQPKHFDFHFRS
jgi:hypothetical protein